MARKTPPPHPCGGFSVTPLGPYLDREVRQEFMILVTGGAGFIGSHLVDRLLDRGETVTCLDDFNDFYSPAIKRGNIASHLKCSRYRLVEGDIRDERLVDQLFSGPPIKKIVHLAARAGVRDRKSVV